MKYDALEIGRYIITYCFNSGFPISNLKLQLILYFVQCESYRQKREALFYNDICAWHFGPVVPDVYYEYCIYAGTPILEVCTTNITNNDATIIHNVINDKINVPTWTLVNQTHKIGTPWYKTFNELGNHAPIPPNLIYNSLEYY